MLLALDIGNTNTTMGAFRGDDLIADWRISTQADRTADEMAILVRHMLGLSRLGDQIEAVIIASVVPGATQHAIDAFTRWFDVAPILIGPGIKSGMPILCENPKQVGSDRVVNALAAYDLMRAGCIVVDFGTATTFDCVTPKGEYLGGVIAPGIEVSAEALHHQAAQLPTIEFRQPREVVGRNTVASMQSGLFFGYVGLVEGIVQQIRDELAFPATVIATGGLAPTIAQGTSCFGRVDPLLTLKGLRLLYMLNQGGMTTDSA